MLLKPRFGRRRCSGIWPPSKPLMRDAGARRLALAAAAGGLALAGADAAADAHALLARAGIVGEFVEFHRSLSVLSIGVVTTLLRRGRGAAPSSIMPRTAGRILQLGDATDLVELQADQRRALRVMAADRAAGLLDRDRLAALAIVITPTASQLSFGDRFGVAADAARLQRRTP